MIFVAGMDDSGKMQKVAHFNRSPPLSADLRKGGVQDGYRADLIPEQPAT
jgi:hypothetical protein